MSKKRASNKTKKKARGRPPTGTTPVRQFRCADELWAEIAQVAKATGFNSASAYIVHTLASDVRKKRPLLDDSSDGRDD